MAGQNTDPNKAIPVDVNTSITETGDAKIPTIDPTPPLFSSSDTHPEPANILPPTQEPTTTTNASKPRPLTTTSLSTSPPPTRTTIETPFIHRVLKIKNILEHSPLTFLSELSLIILEMRYALIVANLPLKGGETYALCDLWDRVKQFWDLSVEEGTRWEGSMCEEFERMEVSRGWGRTEERWWW